MCYYSRFVAISTISQFYLITLSFVPSEIYFTPYHKSFYFNYFYQFSIPVSHIPSSFQPHIFFKSVFVVSQLLHEPNTSYSLDTCSCALTTFRYLFISSFSFSIKFRPFLICSACTTRFYSPVVVFRDIYI